ncbi:ketoacyl-ACP synthase III [Marinifilum fragile]|uniref:ketoacyl-ACP synthase III n=1 Tax=Marinifilum fragile TaxID=570161 RepID=UPI002AA93289|nr:ketoacyl-ACP synthase III [Marinifilum fragile]
MALFQIKNVAIKGVSASVPKNKVNTYDFDFFTKEEANTFIETVGIENRFMAGDDVCASDLCFHAAEKLVSDLGWDKNEIDILAFESVTADYRTPPTSCILQERLGLPESCFTLDMPMGCCGSMYAINVIGSMMSAGTVRKALLLIGDTITRMSSPKDKSRIPLFGDCGTAIALEFDESANDIFVDFNTSGKSFEALITPHSGFRHQVTPDSFEYEDFGNGVVRAPVHSLINGMDVFAFAITKPPKNLVKMMDYCKLDKDVDVDYFLIHQANKMIVDRIVKKAKLNPEKVPMNLKDYANCGGASIPMLMVSNMQKELQEKSLSLVLSSFGLGLTWGTMYLRTDPMVVSDLIIVN